MHQLNHQLPTTNRYLIKYLVLILNILVITISCTSDLIQDSIILEEDFSKKTIREIPFTKAQNQDRLIVELNKVSIKPKGTNYKKEQELLIDTTRVLIIEYKDYSSYTFYIKNKSKASTAFENLVIEKRGR